MKIKALTTNRVDNNKLMKLRLSMGLSKQELAAQLGVSKSTVFEIETNPNYQTTVEIICRYTDFFKVTFLEVLADEHVKIYATNMARHLEFHEVLDLESAECMIDFYSKNKKKSREKDFALKAIEVLNQYIGRAKN